ncbi:hypothetical protein TH63_11240 [Rufibacter radiotolerans]|uniref:Uncharacterized protein n=1 Tax=Rufibacter radiotolerans TaxID=1379910 RepID=A0A0H4W6N9_9BACT|nr:hypothetical protein [Rufibacter radiotolerans]AKQ46076.1 hypothetical protein TH63_11240 [Rufibacter radiotolerans]
MRPSAIIFFLVLVLQVSVLCQEGMAQAVQDTTQIRQDSTLIIYRVEMRDGNEFMGTIISQTNEVLQLKTQNMGVLTIKIAEIKAITSYDARKVKGGKLWFDNPQSSRYFFAPNAFGLKKGEGYYQNTMLLVNQASVGITDNFSLGAGLVPLFLFGGASSPVWLLPKISVPVVKDKFNVGGGALIGTVIGEQSSFGIAYGLTTFGSRDRNATIGLGYGYADGDWATTPAITFSGLFRTGPRGYIITENYYIGLDNDAVGLLSIGGRRIVKRVGIDFGLFSPIGADGFFALPFLGLTVPFGEK